MKKWILFCLVISFIGVFSVSEARSAVSNFKNPEANLTDIDLIIIEPLIYDSNLTIDEFDRQRIEAAFQQEFHSFPIKIHWKSDTMAIPAATNPAYLIIYLKNYAWDRYVSPGHYESYSTTSYDSIIDDYYWDHRGRRHSWGIAPRTISRTFYVDPEENMRARAALQMTLQNNEGTINYWIYTQERFDNSKKSTPDKSLQTILKEAKKQFIKDMKKDAS